MAVGRQRFDGSALGDDFSGRLIAICAMLRITFAVHGSIAGVHHAETTPSLQ